MNIDDLIKAYKEENSTRKYPFLLFELANAKENDHTRVLQSILEYNNFHFLRSFLSMLGLPLNIGEEKISGQKHAIGFGKKSKGYIDLYIEYKSESENNVKEKLIIENKIYGAGDTEKQLTRYVASVLGVKNKEFDQVYEGWKNRIFEESHLKLIKNVYVVYLVPDEEKQPTEDSLLPGLREKLGKNYLSINYLSILQWLEDEVLPNIPYLDNGIMIAGIRQYIAFLDLLFRSESKSKTIGKFINELNNEKRNALELYNEIISQMNEVANKLEAYEEKKREDSKDGQLLQIRRELRSEAISIFSDDISKKLPDWSLHFTPSLLFLYKNSWSSLDARKYSIPSVHLLTSTDEFLKKECCKWSLNVDHLNPSESYQGNNFKMGNRNKTAEFELGGIGKKCEFNINLFDSRVTYYCSVVDQLSSEIKLVDEAVDEAINEMGHDNKKNFQVNLLYKIDEKFTSNQNNHA